MLDRKLYSNAGEEISLLRFLLRLHAHFQLRAPYASFLFVALSYTLERNCTYEMKITTYGTVLDR
jgi:hypothetical protein